MPDVVEGADQPDGTTTLTAPFDMPPAAAVYVIFNVSGVELVTDRGDTVAVPDPSGA